MLVSRLREQGVDPMAIRLAILAHRYRDDWDWTDAGAGRRPGSGSSTGARAVSGNGGPDADGTLAAVRAALADRPRHPRGARRDRRVGGPGLAGTAEPVEGAPGIIGRLLDALLGIRL